MLDKAKVAEIDRRVGNWIFEFRVFVAEARFQQQKEGYIFSMPDIRDGTDDQDLANYLRESLSVAASEVCEKDGLKCRLTREFFKYRRLCYCAQIL